MHLEKLNLVQAVRSLLPQSPHDYSVVNNTDKRSSQLILSTGKGKDKLVCACARKLWCIAACSNCDLDIRHKAGRELVLALSQSSFDKTAAELTKSEC